METRGHACAIPLLSLERAAREKNRRIMRGATTTQNRPMKQRAERAQGSETSLRASSRLVKSLVSARTRENRNEPNTKTPRQYMSAQQCKYIDRPPTAMEAQKWLPGTGRDSSPAPRQREQTQKRKKPPPPKRRPPSPNVTHKKLPPKRRPATSNKWHCLQVPKHS